MSGLDASARDRATGYVDPGLLGPLIAALTAAVRTAARDGVLDALAAHSAKAPAPAPLATKQAAAAALGISTATLDRRIAEGVVPFVQVGDVKRFDLDAIRAAIVANTPPIAAVERPHACSPATPLAGVRRLSRGARA